MTLSELSNNNWFVGICTGLIVLAIPKLGKFLKYHFTKQGFIGKNIRKSAVRSLLKIKSIRRDSVKIYGKISRKNTFFILFITFMCVYQWLLIFITPIHISSLFQALIYASPIFIFEVLYLNQKYFVKDLLKHRDLCLK